jgi:hypothetical protein
MWWKRACLLLSELFGVVIFGVIWRTGYDLGGTRGERLRRSCAIFHWNFTTFVFENVPGLLSQISAGPAGVVWGVDRTGEVFRLSRDKEGAPTE